MNPQPKNNHYKGAFHRLKGIVARIPEEIADPALAELIRKHPRYLELESDRGLSKTIVDFAHRIEPFFDHDPDFADPILTLDLTALLTFLLEHCSTAMTADAPTYAHPLRNTIESLIDRVLTLSGRQIQILCTAMESVVNFLMSGSLAPSRIIILEFPIGNSIPSKLLKQKLEHSSYSCEIARISLNRNDSPTKGRTRNDVLRTCFDEMHICAKDLVIVVEEWLTGSNFFALTRLISKLSNQTGAAFLPVALLSKEGYLRSRRTRLRVPLLGLNKCLSAFYCNNRELFFVPMFIICAIICILNPAIKLCNTLARFPRAGKREDFSR